MLGTSDIKTVRVIPTISTSAYVTGNQVGAGAFKIPSICPDSNYGLVGYNILILDGSKQDQPFDLLFFDSNPTVTSSDRAAADISLANAKGILIGAAQVTTYMDLANVSIGFASFTGWCGQPKSGLDIYCLPIIRGSATYATSASLEFTFGAIVGPGL
jgi:hypothetical protein